MTKNAGVTVWLEDGTPINMKHMMSLPAKVLGEYSSLVKDEANSIKAAMYLVENALEDATDLTKIEGLSLDEFATFLKWWSEQCQVI